MDTREAATLANTAQSETTGTFTNKEQGRKHTETRSYTHIHPHSIHALRYSCIHIHTCTYVCYNMLLGTCQCVYTGFLVKNYNPITWNLS